MKKTLALLLALVLMLSLCACGGSGGKTKLTKENINEYLAITSTVDCNIDTDSGSIGGLGYKNYSGNATADIKITNQSGAKFENVNITLKLEVLTFDANKEGLICGWEFSSGNKHEGTTMADAINYKTVTVSLPYDGNWSSTEKLELALYSQWSDLLLSPAKLSSVYVSVEEVTGTIVK